MTWSPMRVSVPKRMSISHWPPVATSWWWNSHAIPSRSSVSTISVRMSWSESWGDGGK